MIMRKTSFAGAVSPGGYPARRFSSDKLETFQLKLETFQIQQLFFEERVYKGEFK